MAARLLIPQVFSPILSLMNPDSPQTVVLRKLGGKERGIVLVFVECCLENYSKSYETTVLRLTKNF